MTALIVVDLQNDFMPGGSLAVNEGDKILPVINALLKKKFDLVVATKDWHPKDHGSFALKPEEKVGDVVELDGIPQILWPPHCVQGTPGSDFHLGWDSKKVQKIFFKGVDVNVDSYSAFFDNEHKRSTGLSDYLKEHQIKTIYLAGLTTEYCILFSALDALQLGFQTYVVSDGCRGINLKPDDAKEALEKIQKAGGKVIHLSEMDRGGGI